MSSQRTPRLISAFALGATLLASALANAALTKQGSSTVLFTAVGPAGMKIEGKTSDLSTKDDGKEIKIVVPLSNLDTGMSLRDRHMKEKYLEVGKNPTAELSVARSGLSFPADGASSSGKAQAKLLLHGVTRDVTFAYTAKNNGGVYSVKGDLAIDMRDYKIDVPSYLGVTVKPNVDVTASFTATDP